MKNGIAVAFVVFVMLQVALAGQSTHPSPTIVKVQSVAEFEGGPRNSNGMVVPRELVAISLGPSGANGSFGILAGNPSQTGTDATFTQGHMSARMCDMPMWVYFNNGTALDGSGLLYVIVPLAAAGKDSCKLVVQESFEDGSVTSSDPFEVKISQKPQDQALLILDSGELLPLMVQPDGNIMTRSFGLKAGDVVTMWGIGCGPTAGLFEYQNNPKTGLATDKPVVSINGAAAEVLSAGFSPYYAALCQYQIRIPASATVTSGPAIMMIGAFGPYTVIIR